MMSTIVGILTLMGRIDFMHNFSAYSASSESGQILDLPALATPSIAIIARST